MPKIITTTNAPVIGFLHFVFRIVLLTIIVLLYFRSMKDNLSNLFHSKTKKSNFYKIHVKICDIQKNYLFFIYVCFKKTDFLDVNHKNRFAYQ